MNAAIVGTVTLGVIAVMGQILSWLVVLCSVLNSDSSLRWAS